MKHFTRPRTLLLFVLILASFGCLTSCDMTEDTSIKTWDKTFAIGSYSTAGRVIETQDGGFLSAGTINYKLTLMKVDSDGNQEWYCSYTDEDGYNDWEFDFRETQEGYVLAVAQPDGITARVIHTDKNGLETHSITVADPSIKKIASLTLSSENSVTILAQSESDVVVIGFDETGTAVWSTHYGTAEDIAQIIHKTKTGYVAAGFCTGMTRMFKLDEVGGIVWRRTLPMGDLLSFGGISFSAIDETDDGGFKVSVTLCEKNGYGCQGSVVYSIAPSGLTTGKTTMLNIFVNSIRHTSDNGFVLIGGNAVFNNEYYGTYTARYSQGHYKLFSNLISEENSGADIYGNDIALTSDGGYILCGQSDRRFWLRKVNNVGNLNE